MQNIKCSVVSAIAVITSNGPRATHRKLRFLKMARTTGVSRVVAGFCSTHRLVIYISVPNFLGAARLPRLKYISVMEGGPKWAMGKLLSGIPNSRLSKSTSGVSLQLPALERALSQTAHSGAASFRSGITVAETVLVGWMPFSWAQNTDCHLQCAVGYQSYYSRGLYAIFTPIYYNCHGK